MLNIDKDSTLEVLLAGAITTNQIPFVVSYNNRLNTTYLNGEIYSKKISGTNAVVMLPVITSDTAFRIIEDINITNSDTVSADVTIRTKNNNQYYNLITVSLDSGDTLQYSSGNGWSVITSTGQIKTGSSGGGMVYPGVGIALSTGASWGASITDNSTNWNTAYSWGNHALAGYATATNAMSFTNKTGNISQWTNDSGYLTSINSTQITTALGYTPVTNARTLTINGTTYDLTADRSWTISTGTTYTFSTGLTNIAGTITSNLSTGVSGGQSVVGGTASGQNLTLQSTSNATKGKIIFGTSAYDEVNNRLGIGTISPTASLDVS